MSPRDPKQPKIELDDESLGKVLGQWAKERDSDRSHEPGKAASKMSIERKAVLYARLAEISWQCSLFWAKRLPESPLARG